MKQRLDILIEKGHGVNKAELIRRALYIGLNELEKGVGYGNTD